MDCKQWYFLKKYWENYIVGRHEWDREVNACCRDFHRDAKYHLGRGISSRMQLLVAESLSCWLGQRREWRRVLFIDANSGTKHTPSFKTISSSNEPTAAPRKLTATTGWWRSKIVINHKAVINYSSNTRARLSIEFWHWNHLGARHLQSRKVSRKAEFVVDAECISTILGYGMRDSSKWRCKRAHAITIKAMWFASEDKSGVRSQFSARTVKQRGQCRNTY